MKVLVLPFPWSAGIKFSSFQGTKMQAEVQGQNTYKPPDVRLTQSFARWLNTY